MCTSTSSSVAVAAIGVVGSVVLRNSGPWNHNGCLASSSGVIPRLAQSAGFSFVLTWWICDGLRVFRMAFVRLFTNLLGCLEGCFEVREEENVSSAEFRYVDWGRVSHFSSHDGFLEIMEWCGTAASRHGVS